MNRKQSLKFEHVAVTVKDMKQSIAFYRDILGFSVMGKLVLQDGDFLIVYLKSDFGPVLELFELKEKGKFFSENLDDKNLGYKHLCFSVADVDEYSAYLKSKGVTFLVEPKKASTSSIRLAFFQDPDGNKIEIVSGQPELLAYED